MHYPCLTALVLSTIVYSAHPAVLDHSDVVFMYQAARSVYQTYDATAVAWGGKPTAASLAESKGLKFFGSVGMVTEFGRYYERFPTNYQEGLCRDVHGRPVKVPWLTDHTHKGVPFWWCCTQQPRFRQYLEERVAETVRAGADGVHIDDHMGTAGGLWLGVCFCDRCVAGFRDYLKRLPATELEAHHIAVSDTFDYAQVIRAWLGEDSSRKVTNHPLWPVWEAYECRAAAAFMQQLREVAAQTAGHSVPIGANAGLLWPRHLVDYQSLDLFSAETDHRAHAQKFSDLPLFAYRLAEAVDRPYTATASGQDWAYIKEHNLPGLVCSWIAYAYAAGQTFMVPNHQWCYTPEKGTHWYDGPAEKFAPLYQFVRQHVPLFNGYDTFADVAVVLPHRSFVKEPNRWFTISQQLAAKNVSFRLLLAGDDIVDHPLAASDLNASSVLLTIDTDGLLPADRELLNSATKAKRVFTSADALLAAIHPAVDVQAETSVRGFPRVKKGAVVVHLLNENYQADRDSVLAQHHVRVRLDLQKLGLNSSTPCQFVDWTGLVETLELHNGVVEVPNLDLWGLLCLGANAAPRPAL